MAHAPRTLPSDALTPLKDLDVLNNKFDALADEVRFLRKSVRLMEDKVDSPAV